MQQLVIAALFFICALVSTTVANAEVENELDTVTRILGNLTYPGPESGMSVTLVDGMWEGKPAAPDDASHATVSLAPRSIRIGDLNGDGKDDAVVLLRTSGGGTGVFNDLAVVTDVAGAPELQATWQLGDRVQLRLLEIQEAEVRVAFIEAGPNDPMCCPGQVHKSVLKLGDGGFEEVRSMVQTASYALLDGSAWTLLSFADEPIDPVLEITAEFADGRIAGLAACNNYAAGFEVVDGSAVKLGMAAVTRKLCRDLQMAAEQRYLDALSRVTAFAFADGDLLLLGDGGDLPLRFKAAAP